MVKYYLGDIRVFRVVGIHRWGELCITYYVCLKRVKVTHLTQRFSHLEIVFFMFVSS